MAQAPIHTIAVEGGWVNRRHRSGVVRQVYRTNSEARRAGEDTARRFHTEHVIHADNGRVRLRQSFD